MNQYQEVIDVLKADQKKKLLHLLRLFTEEKPFWTDDPDYNFDILTCVRDATIAQEIIDALENR